MNTQHTTGPWKAQAQKARILVFRASDAADVCSVPLHLVVNNDRRFADARLIAQAPALLANLIEAAETLRRYESLHLAKGTEDGLSKALVNSELAARFEATIARATGEMP